MMLVEEARIALGNPVSRFFPAYARTMVATRGDTGRVLEPANHAITIKQLLMGASTVWIPGSGWCWCSCSNQLPNSTDIGQKLPTIVYQALAR